MSQRKDRSRKRKCSKPNISLSSRQRRRHKAAPATSAPHLPLTGNTGMVIPGASPAPSLFVMLIDGQKNARRDAVIQAAFDAIRRMDSRAIYRNVVISSYTPLQRPEILAGLNGATEKNVPTVVLVVVAEHDRALPVDPNVGRIPCDSIALGYSLIDQIGTANDIYYVVNNFTAVESLSLLLSGARGVIDTDSLGSVQLLTALVDGTLEPDKRLNRKLAGQPYHELEATIDVWRRNLQIAEKHWSLVLALAEIPLLRLPTPRTRAVASAMPADGKTKAHKQPTQKYIALEIGRYSSVTGFSDSGSDRLLPDVLKMLEIGVKQIETGEQGSYEPSSTEKRRRLAQDEMFELPFLPVYARRAGFPSRLLPIRGINDTQLSDRLYAGISRVEFKRTSLADTLVIADVTVPRDLSK